MSRNCTQNTPRVVVLIRTWWHRCMAGLGEPLCWRSASRFAVPANSFPPSTSRYAPLHHAGSVSYGAGLRASPKPSLGVGLFKKKVPVEVIRYLCWRTTFTSPVVDTTCSFTSHSPVHSLPPKIFLLLHCSHSPPIGQSRSGSSFIPSSLC